MTQIPRAAFIQKRVLIWLWLICSFWIVAVERPRSLNSAMKPVTTVTMATSP